MSQENEFTKVSWQRPKGEGPKAQVSFFGSVKFPFFVGQDGQIYGIVRPEIAKMLESDIKRKDISKKDV